MSDKPSAKKSSGITKGALGLVLAIISCASIASSPGGGYSVFLAGALGLAGLGFSIIGIAKGSGRVAGVFGILVFLLGCLMTFSVVLDIIAYHRAHPR